MTRILALLAAAWLLAMPGPAPAQVGPEITISHGVPSAYKEVVELRYVERNGLAATCSGVLVSASALLTAAHCACGRSGSYEMWQFMAADGDARKSSNRKLFADDWKRRKLDDPVPFLKKACTAERYIVGFDVAYATFISDEGPFAPPKKGAEIVSPLHLWEDGVPHLTVIGYGHDEMGRRPNAPLEANVNVQSFFCTTGSVLRSPCVPFREFVLADERANRPRDTCRGDSGGPVVFRSAEGTFLVGVTSRGIRGSRNIPGLTCGGGGIYTALAHREVVDWLSKNGITLNIKR